MTAEIERLGERFGAWWIDFLGEHCHVGGDVATKWLVSQAGISKSDVVLDAGAFVGAAARLVADTCGAWVVATDANSEFLATGAGMPGGDGVRWVAAANHRLPFPDGAFTSVWCLDAYVAPREFSRVAARRASLCLCTDTPDDGRGGAESFVEEWAEFGWRLAAHRSVSSEAVLAWQHAEATMVGRRSFYEPRYGKRAYLMQLDQVAELVRSYTMHERGHALFVFRRE